MHNKKLIVAAMLVLMGIVSINAQAQFTTVGRNSVMEFSGWFTPIYNFRFYNPQIPSNTKDKIYAKDAIGVDYARLNLHGMIKGKFEYNFEYDLANTFAGNTDVTASPVTDANVSYTGCKWFNVEAGYMKVPFSYGSMITEKYAAFLGRPEVVRTGFFSRRDVGVLLYKDFLNQTLNVNLGMYSGMGESALLGVSDAKGQPSYMARVTYAYPSKYRDRDVDLVGVPVPMFRIGVNGSYNNRATDMVAGHGVGSVTPNTFINGEKYNYGADFCFQYKHFSMQFEADRFRYQPWDLTTIPVNLNGNVVTKHYLAGGWYGQLNYYLPKIKSSFSVRYDNINANDVVKGDMGNTVSYSYQYYFNQYKYMFRVQYWQRLQDTDIKLPIENDQLRIGFQFLF
ncbi:MAG: hypothetical protein RJA07_1112 [Bacteroidota bacterium]|jgi:hypothetical protein